MNKKRGFASRAKRAVSVVDKKIEKKNNFRAWMRGVPSPRPALTFQSD